MHGRPAFCSEPCSVRDAQQNWGSFRRWGENSSWNPIFSGTPTFAKYILVGGLEHFSFFHILGIIIPTDSYFSEGLKPPASIKIWGHGIWMHLVSWLATPWRFSRQNHGSWGGGLFWEGASGLAAHPGRNQISAEGILPLQIPYKNAMNAVLDHRKQPQMLRFFRRTPLGVWSSGFFQELNHQGMPPLKVWLCAYSPGVQYWNWNYDSNYPKPAPKLSFLGQPAVFFCCHEAENGLSSKDLVIGIGIQDKMNPGFWGKSQTRL